jgi:acyl-homoserine lactone acylase PvdQ
VGRAVPAVIVGLILAAAPAAAAKDFSGTARNIIPSGQYGSVPPPAQASVQARMYDGLTPLFDKVSDGSLTRFFKSEKFGVTGKVARVEKPRSGVRIERDRFDVPHVYGKTRGDVTFGAGWALAEDRGLLIEQARYVARLAAIDAPGQDAFSLLKSLRQFAPSGQTEAEVANQTRVLKASGADGAQVLRDIDSYTAGINAYYRKTHNAAQPWGRNDVYAINALGGFIFGRGGGDETRRSELLNALQARLGPGPGMSVFDDLRERQDPEAVVTMPGRFPYETGSEDRSGNVVIDDGSFKAVGGGTAAYAPRQHASNFLIAGARRSANGHPLFVAGPQIGYYYPGLTFELDLHGGGFDTRGAASALGPYVFIGRGPNYAWSLTSAGSDVIDQFAETLCDGSDTKYLYKGKCTDMGTFDAGALKGTGGAPDQEIVFSTTVHGPVIGYATSGGQRVAISFDRSSYGRDVLWQLPFMRLDTGAGKTAKGFINAMGDSPFTFNNGYANDRDIAMISTGRMPVRAPGVDPSLPTKGTGEFDWRGFLPASRLPHVIDPKGDELVNWNNKPALGWSAADDEWSYGPVQRVNMLMRNLNKRRKNTLATVTGAMNAAATQDFRALQMQPLLDKVLATGPPPNARDAQMVSLLDGWRASGASRLDRDDDGNIDSPGAAIIDAAYPKIADAVMRPVIGPQLDQLNRLILKDSTPACGFFCGWSSYIDKDLRALLGQPVKGPFANRYCGGGDLTACRDALWGAIDAAGNELQAAQGPDPAQWRSSAIDERITFAPGILPTTIRYTNRPSGIQQVIDFTGHP